MTRGGDRHSREVTARAIAAVATGGFRWRHL